MPKKPSVRRVKLSEFVSDPKNPRSHPDKAKKALGKSVKRFGAARSIVVDGQNTVRAGNGTIEAALAAGVENALVVDSDGKELVIVRRPDWTEAEAVAYAVADNKAGDLSFFDPEALKSVFGELKFDEGLLDATGFEPLEIADLLREEGSTVEDEAPEPPKEAVSRLGDLWLLGDHRLLCGDSADAEAVGRLMGGERAGLYNVDAPYGVDYDNSDRTDKNGAGQVFERRKKETIQGDKLDGTQLQDFLERPFRVAKEHALKPDAAWYLWHPMLTQGTFFAAAAAAAAAVVIHRQIIWIKPHFLIGRGMFHWKHELCFMGWVEGSRPPDYAERNQTTVWEIDGVTNAERKEFDHSTPKPVKLFEIPIVKHLREGEICFDGFGGTFPQLVAAQQLGRRFFGMDLEPRYCDVGVIRWQNLTGEKATLDGTGETFDVVKAKRARKPSRSRKQVAR